MGVALLPVVLRRWLSVALAAAAVVAVIASAARGYGHTWRLMSREHAAYAHLTAQQREQAFGNAVPLPMNVFDFYRANLHRGDRYYPQVLKSGFGQFANLRTAVRAVARFYLLPATEQNDPKRATVILSYQTYPQLLHVPYVSVRRLGQQDFSVARPLPTG